jgi:hypothetical protein
MSQKRIYGQPMAGSRPTIEIPIDAHPDVIKGDSPMLEPARRAQTAIWDVWNKVKVAQGEVTDKKRLAEVAQKAVERSLSVTDTNGKHLHQSRKTLVSRIDATVRPKAPDAVGVEIRSHMKAGKKAFFEVAEQINKGDKRTVAAVLTAPAYLSGLDDKQYNTLLDMAQKMFCPDETTTLGQIDKAITRLDRSVEQMTETFAPLIREWLGNDDKALEDLQNHGK